MEKPNQCLYCQKAIRGRIDKKFCSDFCRNNYNNRMNSDVCNAVRNINNRLRRNRRILEEVLSQARTEVAKTSRSKLVELGFDFKYLTNVIKTKQQKTYYFCYEFGYMPTENDWLLVVKSKDESLR